MKLVFLVLLLGLAGCGKNSGGENNTVSPNRLVVTDIEYSSVGNSYKLDASLGLTVIKSYHLNGQVAYRDPSSQTNVGDLNGDYVITVSLIPFETTSITDAYFITDSKTIHIEEGILNATVELPLAFSELPLLVSPSQLLVQLEPLTNDSPRGISLTTRFDNFSVSGRLAMEKLAIPASQLIQNYLAEKKVGKLNLSNLNSKIAFEEALRLRPFGLDALRGIAVTEQEFDYITSQLLNKAEVPREIASKYCTWIYPYPSPEWRLCTQHPEQMISLFASRHINKITSQPEIKSVDSYFIQLSDFKFTELTSSEEQFGGSRDTEFKYHIRSKMTKIEGKLGFNFYGNGGEFAFAPFIDESGVRIGREWFHVQQHIDRQTKGGVRKSYSKNRNLQVQEWQLSFGADIYRCLTIVSKHLGREGVHLCRAEASQVVSEHWYFLNQSEFNAGGPMPINNNSNERLLSAAVRGQNNFEEMMNLFSSNTEVVFQKSVRSRSMFKDGSFPGMITQ